jgi:hypothetical protein
MSKFAFAVVKFKAKHAPTTAINTPLYTNRIFSQ